jgi:hypothetical protein
LTGILPLPLSRGLFCLDSKILSAADWPASTAGVGRRQQWGQFVQLGSALCGCCCHGACSAWTQKSCQQQTGLQMQQDEQKAQEDWVGVICSCENGSGPCHPAATPAFARQSSAAVCLPCECGGLDRRWFIMPTFRKLLAAAAACYMQEDRIADHQARLSLLQDSTAQHAGRVHPALVCFPAS